MVAEQRSRNQKELSHLLVDEWLPQLTLKAATLPDVVQADLITLLLGSCVRAHRTCVSSFYKKNTAGIYQVLLTLQVWDRSAVHGTKESRGDSFILLLKAEVGEATSQKPYNIWDASTLRCTGGPLLYSFTYLFLAVPMAHRSSRPGIELAPQQ